MDCNGWCQKSMAMSTFPRIAPNCCELKLLCQIWTYLASGYHTKCSDKKYQWYPMMLFFFGGGLCLTYIYIHKIHWYVLSSGTVPESIVLARKACGLPGVVTALNTLRPVADTLSWSQLGIKEAQGITFVLQETSSTSGIIAGQSSLGTRGCCGLDFHVSQRMNMSCASTLSLSHSMYII